MLRKDTFTRHDARSSELSIVNERKIGSGADADAYEATIDVEGKQAMMVIKKFRPDPNFGPEKAAKRIRELVERSLTNYEVLKKNGFKVFTTYRKNEDSTNILMTNGTNNEFICLGGLTPGNTSEHQGEVVEDITNFKEVVDIVFSEAERAAHAGITIPFDTYFFSIDRTTHSKLEYVLGDLEGVRSKGNPGLALLKNVQDCALALRKINTCCKKGTNHGNFDYLYERSEATLKAAYDFWDK